jgi:RNA polymerase sigma-70 factor (ECF subfamily)
VNQEDLPGVSASKSPDAAFDEFCRDRYERLVLTVRVIVQDHALAQDIAQETFARAYLHWSKLWPDGNPGGWVHRVATNLAISWRRRAVRETRAIARLGRRDPLTTHIPDLHPELQRAVAALPPRQRAAVALHYVLDLPVADVARAMRCKEGTVKSLLFSARENLRSTVGEP